MPRASPANLALDHPSLESALCQCVSRDKLTSLKSRARLNSTNWSLVFQSVDDPPGLRADNPVHGHLESLLQILDRRLGLRSVTTIDTADVKSDEAHPLLRTTDGKTSRPDTQNGL